ncbi:hypothetical protein [Photobacterium sp. J15]|uniref:hypothetical protein n=1 Tax=Photobacterium sp. J15 TaxID=265901 RepID=UPI0007E4AE5D
MFLGDLIDNKDAQGADHISTLDHVKSLVEQGVAYCVMGNHEFNAIGWSIQKQDGSYCRYHNKPGNIKQHQLFLEHVGENSDEHIKWVQWIKTLHRYWSDWSVWMSML